MRPLVLLSVLLVGAVASADAIDVSITPRGAKGKGRPGVTVRILEPIAGFRLALSREGGQPLEIKGGGKPGATRFIELEHPDGRAHWKGSLFLNLPDGSTGEMPLEFDTEYWSVPLSMSLEKDRDVDVPGRQVTFRLTRPAGKATVRVLMDTGKLAFDGEVPFAGEAPGQPLSITWPEAPGQVMRIDLQAYDTAGFYTGVEITPWRVDIPHEEVSFDSGRADVKASEGPKLDASWELIRAAVVKYGRLAEIRLYVAGHTDTVGAAASNHQLSLQRARAIGVYFRKKGLQLPIYFEGFGEDALAVSTADETDEPRNRRAEYIISIDDPVAKGSRLQAHWQRL